MKKSSSFGRNGAPWWRGKRVAYNSGEVGEEEGGAEGGGRGKGRRLHEVMAARCFGIITGKIVFQP